MHLREEFRDDDAGYLAWLAAYPDGYVINVARNHSAPAARTHRAGCRTISGQNPRGGPWTGPYVKVCAEHPRLPGEREVPESRRQIPVDHAARSAAHRGESGGVGGANVKAVQRMLGHAKASMTLDVYADLFDEDLDDVAANLDAAIRSAADRAIQSGVAGYRRCRPL